MIKFVDLRGFREYGWTLRKGRRKDGEREFGRSSVWYRIKGGGRGREGTWKGRGGKSIFFGLL